MSNIIVSIIIPVYNRESIIKNTIDSIIHQTFTRWECIIVDDGSSDNTEKTILEYIEKDSRFKFVKRPEYLRKGANSCRNYGYELSKGQYINWFDSDDIMMPAFLEKKVIAFAIDTDAVIHRNRYANYELTRFRKSKFNHNNGKSLFYNYAMETIEIQTCGFMWKKTFLKGKELFNENITRYQDNEFHIRMLAINTLEIKFLESVLATIRSGNGDKSQISSQATLTKQKLYDVFYYRYQCLKLASENKIAVDANFNKTISKKTLWAFYAGLRFEPNLIRRFEDLINYRTEIFYVYNNPHMTVMDILKSRLYIFKTLVFR